MDWVALVAPGSTRYANPGAEISRRRGARRGRCYERGQRHLIPQPAAPREWLRLFI